MINFDDIKIMDHEEMIFLPVCLANDIAEYLMDNKTQNTSLKCKMLQPAKIRKDADLCEARQKYFKEHAAFFKDSSFEDYPVERYAGVITNIASDWIYENLPKFYIDGDEEDEDVARWGKEKVKPMLFLLLMIKSIRKKWSKQLTVRHLKPGLKW